MSIYRRAARVDANQSEIVAAMEAEGASVWPIRQPVDLLVGYMGCWALVEVKTMTGKKNPRPNDHTALQKRFLLDHKGGIVATVTDVEGALRVLAMMESACAPDR